MVDRTKVAQRIRFRQDKPITTCLIDVTSIWWEGTGYARLGHLIRIPVDKDGPQIQARLELLLVRPKYFPFNNVLRTLSSTFKKRVLVTQKKL